MIVVTVQNQMGADGHAQAVGGEVEVVGAVHGAGLAGVRGRGALGIDFSQPA